MDIQKLFDVDAFIFDKDGTLVDSEIIWYEALDALLASFDMKHDLETHCRMMGTGLLYSVRLLQEQRPRLPRDPAWVERFADEWRDLYTSLYQSRGIRLMPSAEAFVTHCASTGKPVALATSSHRSNVEHEIRELGWGKIFDAIVTADDVTNRKPNPEPYLLAARRLGRDPRRCVAFEDSESGIRSAAAAGMYAVFIRDERFNAPVPPGTSLVVSSFLELMP